MKEPDYYSVMRRRIDYFAAKYDPHGRYSMPEPLKSQPVAKEIARKGKGNRLSKVYSSVISFFF
jgi:hypothetical protein